MPTRARILDVGSAQGYFLIACTRMGHDCIGVEPHQPAIDVSHALAARLGVTITVKLGNAESLPLETDSFDIVHANSFIEHVADAATAFVEAYRVLKPGGVLWFLTASSLSPMQEEIRGFPAFGWYPDGLKRRIMQWALDHRRWDLRGDDEGGRVYRMLLGFIWSSPVTKLCADVVLPACSYAAVK